VALPQRPDFHLVQAAGLAEGVQDVAADGGVPLFAPSSFRVRRILVLLLRRHRFLQGRLGKEPPSGEAIGHVIAL
jgi:hypothetical protein